MAGAGVAGEHSPGSAVIAIGQKIKIEKSRQRRYRTGPLQVGDGPLLAPLVQPQQQKSSEI